MNHAITIMPLGDQCLTGPIWAAASKSSMQRACAAALVANTKSVIRNPGHSNDDKAALDIIKKMGAIVEINNEYISVNSSDHLPVNWC